MKTINTNVCLLILIVICFGCKKECTEYRLGDLTLVNPFNGNEQIIYADSSGNEYSFVGEGRRNRLTNFDHDGECYNEEIDDCFYRESEGKYQIKISLRPTTFHDPAFLFIELTDYTYNPDWAFISNVIFNIPLDKNNLKDEQFYFDSLLVNNTMHYEVFAGIRNLSTHPITKATRMDTVHPSMFYYNIHNGLIKIDFDDDSSWELDHIDWND